MGVKPRQNYVRYLNMIDFILLVAVLAIAYAAFSAGAKYGTLSKMASSLKARAKAFLAN